MAKELDSQLIINEEIYNINAKTAEEANVAKVAMVAEEATTANTATIATTANTAKKADEAAIATRAQSADKLSKAYSEPGHGTWTINYDCDNISELYTKLSNLLEDIGRLSYLMEAILSVSVDVTAANYIQGALSESLSSFKETLREAAEQDDYKFEDLKVIYQAILKQKQ